MSCQLPVVGARPCSAGGCPLIVYGALDKQANNPATLPAVAHFSVPDLYKAIAGSQKRAGSYVRDPDGELTPLV
ncbi:hypothetical protein [Streptomyces sp. NPDC003996]